MTETTQNSNGRFLPATFAQRGVAVAFTTPVLSFARLRRTDSGELQYLVPGLSGGVETFVIPAASIADVVNLTVFDRHLMEAIDGDKVNLAPLAMRHTSLTRAKTGLAGARRAKRAVKLLEQDRQNKTDMSLLLVQNAVEQLSADNTAVDLPPDSLETGAALSAVEEHLEGFLADAGVSANHVVSRCEIWAASASFVGSPDGAINGPMKLLIQDLERMSADLLKWLVPEPVGPAEMAQRIASAATEAVTQARKGMTFLDASFGSMGQPLKDWKVTKPALKNAVRRMSEILDGWRRIVDMWDRVADRERVDQRELVELFGLYMPVLPVEAAGEKTAFWEDIRSTQKRWEQNAALAAKSLLDVDEKVHDKLHKYQKEVA